MVLELSGAWGEKGGVFSVLHEEVLGPSSMARLHVRYLRALRLVGEVEAMEEEQPGRKWG